jgi:hypothetical protein
MDFIEFSQGCMVGDMNVLQYAKQFKDQRDILNWSGLNHAINGHCSNLAMILIQQDYSIANVDIHGRNILMNACMHGMVHVVAHIINQGVDISILDRYNHDALYYSLRSHNNVISNMLLDRDAFNLSKCKVDIFETCCKDGNINVLSRLSYHDELRSSLDRYIKILLFLDDVECIKPFMYHVVFATNLRYGNNILAFLQHANMIHSDPTITMNVVLTGNFSSQDFLSMCANGGNISIIQKMIKVKICKTK